MKAQVFLKQEKEDKYDDLGAIEFSFPPRENEFISAELRGKKKYFQVIAVHHVTQPAMLIEIYAVETVPTWEIKKKRGIGFGA